MTPDLAFILIVALLCLWAAHRERLERLREDAFQRTRLHYGHAPSQMPQPARAGGAVLPRQTSAAVAAQLRGTELWTRLTARDTHDFRDMGDPLEKVYPLSSWQSWARRTSREDGR